MTCKGCGANRDLRLGFCFDCATDGERRAAMRSVVQHLLHIPRCLVHRNWFGAKTDLMWAWERLTKTGDYAPGGEFENQYGVVA